MREDWNSTTLKNVCTIEKAKHDGKSLPYVGLEHIESNTGRYLGTPETISVKSSTFQFTREHVLYGRLRPYLNKVLLPEFDGHCSSEIFPLRVKSDLNRRFLYYWLTWQPVVEEIDKTSTGARMPRANVRKVLEFELPLPPLPEQKRIVAILDEAFAGIATAVANTEKNLANASELFESCLSFTFDQSTACKPKGWEVVRLFEICEKITDGVHRKPNYVTEGIPFIKIKNLTSGPGISFDNVSYISEEDHKEFSKRTNPEKGDILITKDGTIGIVRVIDTDVRFSIFVSVALIKPKDKEISPYLKYVLESPVIQNEIKPQGAALKHLYLRDLRKFDIPLAPQQERDKIVAELDTLSDEIRRVEFNYQQKLAALAELKQSLLQKAFSGELTPCKEAANATLKEEEVA